MGRISSARKAEILNKYLETGSKINKREYASQHGVSYQTFLNWLKASAKLRDSDRFVPIEVHALGSCFAEVVLSSGKRIILHQMVSPQYLHALLSC